MKKPIITCKIICVLFSLVFIAGLSSCEGLFSHSKNSGVITIHFVDKVSKAIVPDISMDPSSYVIRGSGPGDLSFERTATPGVDETIDNLKTGTWSVIVEAKNADGVSIGTGTESVDVVADETTEVTISISPYSGTGELSLTLTWPAADVGTPTVEASLVSSDDSSIPLTVILTSGQANITGSSIKTGYQTLIVQLFDYGELSMGTVDVVRIIKDQTTTGNLIFTNINKMSGDMLVDIAPALADPLAVSISGTQPTRTLDSTLSLEASVTNYNENTAYCWYVNGVFKADGPSFDFGSEFAEGYYRIDVTAFSYDGKRAGSSSTLITVLP